VVGLLAGVLADVVDQRKNNYPPSLDMRIGMLFLFIFLGVPVLFAALIGRVRRS
jgi:hypothetical protein